MLKRRAQQTRKDGKGSRGTDEETSKASSGASGGGGAAVQVHANGDGKGN